MAELLREKITLLYILNVSPGLTRDEILEAAATTLTTDYFTFALAINELEKSELIFWKEPDYDSAGITDNGSHNGTPQAFLSPYGQETSSALTDQLAPSVREWLKQYLNETAGERAWRRLLQSRYFALDNGNFALECHHDSEHGDAFKLTIEFPNEELARRAHFSFKRDPAKLYGTLINSLLDEDQEDAED